MGSRNVLVTGASSGLGRALSVELASQGAHVALLARRKEELEEVARAVEEKGSRALVLPVDVSDAHAAADTVRRAHRELGALDMVIANAGVSFFGPLSSMSWDDVARLIDVNVRGTMATIHAAIPIFMEQKGGHIVGVTSLAGQRGLPYLGPYCASKAAVSTFLESCRQDLAASNIRVTDVQPGYVDTAMSRDIPNRPLLWSSERAARYIVRRLASAPPAISFPWPLALSTRLSRHMPNWLFDPLARRSTGAPKTPRTLKPKS